MPDSATPDTTLPQAGATPPTDSATTFQDGTTASPTDATPSQDGATPPPAGTTPGHRQQPPWNVKGVSRETRAAVRLAAKRLRMPIGEFVDRALVSAATDVLKSGSLPEPRPDPLAVQLAELAVEMRALREGQEALRQQQEALRPDQAPTLSVALRATWRRMLVALTPLP